MISQIKHEIKMAMIRKRKLREYLETEKDLSLVQKQKANEEIESLNRRLKKLSDDLDREYDWRNENG